MPLFPAENLNIQAGSLQISLMSLRSLANVLWCGGGACHRVPPGLITRGAFSICIDCLGCFLAEQLGQVVALGGEERTERIPRVMKEGR